MLNILDLISVGCTPKIVFKELLSPILCKNGCKNTETPYYRFNIQDFEYLNMQ